MRIRIRNKKLWLSIYIFLVFFAPPLVPKPRFVIGTATALYLLMKKNNLHIIKKYMSRSRIYIWAAGIIIYISHMFLMMLVNEMLYGDTVQLGHYTSLYNRFLISLIEIVPCTILILYKMDRYYYDADDFLQIVFGAALIEAATVVLAVISPDMKGLFNRIAGFMDGGGISGSGLKTWYTTVRSFGFADTLVDTYGWGSGLLAGLALIYGVLKQRKYIIVSFILLLSPLFNARTGVVMYAAAVAVVIACCAARLDCIRILKILLYAAVFIMISTAIWNMVIEYYPATADWIASGLEDFTAVLGNGGTKDDVSGFAARVQDNRVWELPQFPRILFGTGHSRYGAEGYINADFGYVNDIWAGGLYGCVVLYGTNLIFTLRLLLRRQVDKCHKIMIVYMGMTLFAFNVKACAYGCNSGMVSYTLVTSYLNYYYSNRNVLPVYADLRHIIRRVLYAV